MMVFDFELLVLGHSAAMCVERHSWQGTMTHSAQ